MILLLFLAGCYSVQQQQSRPVKISLVRDMLIAEIDGKTTKVYDSIGLYYSGDYVLCQLPNHYQESKLRIVDVSPDEATIIDSVVFEETRYNYFAYRKGDRTGFLYDSTRVKDWKRIIADTIDRKKWRQVNLDSMLKERMMQGIDFSSVPKMARLNRTIEDRYTNNIIQVYTSPERKEETYDDSVYLYFSKSAVHLPFSFSKELDSTMGSKLYQVRILFNEKYSYRYKVVIPGREYRFTMKEEKIENEKIILDFFQGLFGGSIPIPGSLQ